MLERTLTVELIDGTKYVDKKGDAILEVTHTLHNGYNSGSDTTVLLVFYTGTESMPDVIKEENSATIRALLPRKFQ